jgi:hypothetical protein
MESPPHPRDPGEYHYTDHLTDDILPDANRHITVDLIEQTIREGRNCLRSQNAGQIRRKKTVDGVDVVVVLGDRGGFAVVTAWTELVSAKTAFNSDRWDMEAIETIQALDIQNRTQADSLPL